MTIIDPSFLEQTEELSPAPVNSLKNIYASLKKRTVQGLALADTGLDWLLRGWAQLVPEAWLSWRQRPTALLVLPDIEGQKETLVRVRSVFGVWTNKVLEDEEQISDLPKISCLPVDQVFRTELPLPSLSASATREAVRLRLEDLSPLPIADTAFAISASQLTVDKTLPVQIAIASKTQLVGQQHSSVSEGSGRTGFLDQDGMFFEFTQAENITSTHHRNLWQTIGFLLGLMVFFAGTNTWLERTNLAQQERLNSHMATLKHQHQQAQTLDALSASLSTIRPIGATELSTIQTQVTNILPDTSWVQTVNLKNGTATITGYVSEGSLPSAPAGQTITVTPSNRTGITDFTWRFPVEVGHE